MCTIDAVTSTDEDMDFVTSLGCGMMMTQLATALCTSTVSM
jgi:hypothetical protein